MGLFPDALHICTYDVRGTLLATGAAKPVRETGLVTHTHQLLRGLTERHPGMRLAVTQTGAAEPGQSARLLTPEGVQADLRYIATRFPQLRGPSGAFFLVGGAKHGAQQGPGPGLAQCHQAHMRISLLADAVPPPFPSRASTRRESGACSELHPSKATVRQPW